VPGCEDLDPLPRPQAAVFPGVRVEPRDLQTRSADAEVLPEGAVDPFGGLLDESPGEASDRQALREPDRARGRVTMPSRGGHRQFRRPRP
jgi:hypothetical protein